MGKLTHFTIVLLFVILISIITQSQPVISQSPGDFNMPKIAIVGNNYGQLEVKGDFFYFNFTDISGGWYEIKILNPSDKGFQLNIVPKSGEQPNAFFLQNSLDQTYIIFGGYNGTVQISVSSFNYSGDFTLNISKRDPAIGYNLSTAVSITEEGTFTGQFIPYDNFNYYYKLNVSTSQWWSFTVNGLQDLRYSITVETATSYDYPDGSFGTTSTTFVFGGYQGEVTVVIHGFFDFFNLQNVYNFTFEAKLTSNALSHYNRDTAKNAVVGENNGELSAIGAPFIFTMKFQLNTYYSIEVLNSEGRYQIKVYEDIGYSGLEQFSEFMTPNIVYGDYPETVFIEVSSQVVTGPFTLKIALVNKPPSVSGREYSSLFGTGETNKWNTHVNTFGGFDYHPISSILTDGAVTTVKTISDDRKLQNSVQRSFTDIFEVKVDDVIDDQLAWYRYNLIEPTSYLFDDGSSKTLKELETRAIETGYYDSIASTFGLTYNASISNNELIHVQDLTNYYGSGYIISSVQSYIEKYQWDLNSGLLISYKLNYVFKNGSGFNIDLTLISSLPSQSKSKLFPISTTTPLTPILSIVCGSIIIRRLRKAGFKS